MQRVCLVIGAGAGIGSHVGRRFAREGYHAVLCRRTDEEGLNRSVATIAAEGGAASGFLLNAVAPDTIEERIAAVEADIGPIEVAVYNLGAQIGDRTLADTSHKTFELGWRLATFGLFRTAASVCPSMEKRGRGNHPCDIGNRSGARQQGPALARGRHGRAAHALPDPQRGVRPQGRSRRSHHHRRHGRCGPIPWAGCSAKRRSGGCGKSGDWNMTGCCCPPGSPTPTSIFPDSTDPRGHTSSICGRSPTHRGGIADIAFPAVSGSTSAPVG